MEPRESYNTVFKRSDNSWLLVSAMCLLVSGCGSNLVQVSGVVTLDGEPLRGGNGVHATVYFQPASGKGTAAVGVLDENGVYHLSSGSQQGIAPGQYIVTLSASEIIQPENASGTPSGKRITAPKYASAKTSNIRFDVQMGDNEFDIPLVSPPNAGRQRRR